MSDMMNKWQKSFDDDKKTPKVIIKTMDGYLVDVTMENDVDGWMSVEEADTSEQRLHTILTEFFPQWQRADWNWEYDFDETLWAKIIGLEIDGVSAAEILAAEDYLEHPLEDIEKQFELRLNETYLATQGITELKRDEHGTH